MVVLSTRRKRRLAGVLMIMLGATIATWLGLSALRDNLMFFFSPAQVVAGEVPAGQPFRVGGLVVEDSVWREADGVTVRFQLTDLAGTVEVLYEGILPDLFRENQGVVVHGTLASDGRFLARQVLARHDEQYMPPEVADALKAAGAMPNHEMVR
jgi:cytochrome c-type biogenesis protein CcmE